MNHEISIKSNTDDILNTPLVNNRLTKNTTK